MLRHIFLALFLHMLIPAAGMCQLDARAELARGLDLPPESLTRVVKEQYRLRINVVYVEGRGLRVASVDPRGPGANMRLRNAPTTIGILEENDVITQIDGQPITGVLQFQKLVQQAEGQCTVTVYDPRTQRSVDWDVAAEKVKVPVGTPEGTRDDNRVIHAVLVGDTDDANIGKAATLNLDNLSQFLESEIPADYLKLYIIKNIDCNAETIIKTIQGIRSGESDTIFYYHTCHGAYDRRYSAGDLWGGQFFQLSGGDLLRKTLLAHLRAKPSRLKVVMTESCNVPYVANLRRLVCEKSVMTATKPRPIEQLLRYHSGYIDLNSASRDQLGWTSEIGGWFSYVALRRFQEDESWETLLPKLKQESSSFYKTQREKSLEVARARGLLWKSPYTELFDQKDMHPMVRYQVVRDNEIETRPEIQVEGMRFKIIDDK
jgi:hypothetical protein